MKVRLLTSMAGRGRTWRCFEVVDLPERHALRLIETRQAEFLSVDVVNPAGESVAAPAGDAPQGDSAEHSEPTEAEQPSVQAGEPDWRLEPLVETPLKFVAEALEQSGDPAERAKQVTLGELARRLADGFDLTALPGIGRGKAKECKDYVRSREKTAATNEPAGQE